MRTERDERRPWKLGAFLRWANWQAETAIFNDHASPALERERWRCPDISPVLGLRRGAGRAQKGKAGIADILILLPLFPLPKVVVVASQSLIGNRAEILQSWRFVGLFICHVNSFPRHTRANIAPNPRWMPE